MFFANAESATPALLYQRTPLTINTFEEQQRAIKVTEDIDLWLGDLIRPQKLEFASDCTSFDLTTRRYFLDYDPLTHSLNFQGLEYFPTEHRSTILAHEYGHVVFRANLKLLNNALIDDALEESIRFRELLQQSVVAIEKNLCLDVPNAERTDAYKNLMKNSYFTFYAMMLGSYDELLSDIYAVLYTGQPDAMYKALGGPTMDWEQKYYITLPEGYRGRDFSYELPLEGWRSDKPSVAFYDMIGGVSDLYNALDPLRFWIWNTYLEKLPPGKRSAFIKAYMRAVGVEFTHIQAKQIWDFPVQDMNKRFKASLQKELAQENIY